MYNIRNAIDNYAVITLGEFTHLYAGQSALYRASPAREIYRGQCLQIICLYAEQVIGSPIMWHESAAMWFDNYDPKLNPWFERIPYTSRVSLRPGDIVIWSKNLPGSGGHGHIEIVLRVVSPTIFIGYGQNWGGAYCHAVTHDMRFITGILRPRTSTPTTQGDEMITTREEALNMYYLLRPNSPPSEAELKGTVKLKTFAQFLRDADGELKQRDANLRGQAEQLAVMSTHVNELNKTVTELQTQKQITADQLKDALARISTQTANLETTHDTMADLAKPVVEPEPEKPSWLVAFVKALTKKG